MITFLAMMLAAAPAVQDDKVDCANAMSQTEMTRCAGLDYGRADKALNAQWLKVKAMMAERDKSLDADDKRPSYSAALLASQRAWIAYRDAQCTIDGYSMRGGSAEPMEINACLASLTDMRVKELGEMLAWN